MWLKGIVMKVKENYAIVLTDDNEFTRIKLKNNLAVGQKIMFTNDDIFDNQIKRIDYKMRRSLVAVAAVLVFIIVTGVMGYNSLVANRVNLHGIIAFVTVDINPGIKISVDVNEKVVEVMALNDDGESLNLTELTGMAVDDAIEFTVTRARETGFLDVNDLVDDYVLITTIPLEETNRAETEAIEAKILNKINESKELQNVNVAMIGATIEELTEAQQSNVPVGLVAASDGFILNDDFISVKDFFADSERLEAFVNRGEIIEKTYENKAALIERYLNQMEAEGIDVKDIKDLFDISKNDFFKAKRLFDLARKEYQQALKSGDKAAIAEAKAMMDNAEKNKDYMEKNKCNMELIKDLVEQQLREKEAVDFDDNKGNGNSNRGNNTKENEKHKEKGNEKSKNRGKDEDIDEEIDSVEDNNYDRDNGQGKSKVKKDIDTEDDFGEEIKKHGNQDQRKENNQAKDQVKDNDQNKNEAKNNNKDKDDDGNDNSSEEDEDNENTGNKDNEDNKNKGR